MALLTMTRGDKRRIRHTVKRPDANGVLQPENLTGAELWFTAKRRLSDGYEQAVIRKSTAPSGGLEATNAAAGEAMSLLMPEDTWSLTDRTVLHYDVQLKTATGDVETVESGQLIVELDVTDTTTP